MFNIWQVFIELHNSRTAGFQANPIAYSEILAYYMLNQIVPDLWEVQTIKRLDAVVMQMYSDESEKSRKAQEKPRR